MWNCGIVDFWKVKGLKYGIMELRNGATATTSKSPPPYAVRKDSKERVLGGVTQ